MLGQEASQPVSEAQVPSTWKRTCKALWAFCSKAMGVRQRVPSLATFFSRGLASLPCPRNTCADVSTYASLDADSIPESVHCKCRLHSPTATSATVGPAALISPGLSFQTCQVGASGTLNPLLPESSSERLWIVLESLGPYWDSLPSQTTCSPVPCSNSGTSVSPDVTHYEDLESACQEGLWFLLTRCVTLGKSL